MNNLDELEKLVQPICDWLGKYGTSNTQIVIDREGARIIENI